MKNGRPVRQCPPHPQSEDGVAHISPQNSSKLGIYHEMCRFFKLVQRKTPKNLLVVDFSTRKYWQYHFLELTCWGWEGRFTAIHIVFLVHVFFSWYTQRQPILTLRDSLPTILNSPLIIFFWGGPVQQRHTVYFLNIRYHTRWCPLVHASGPWRGHVESINPLQ